MACTETDFSAPKPDLENAIFETEKTDPTTCLENASNTQLQEGINRSTTTRLSLNFDRFANLPELYDSEASEQHSFVLDGRDITKSPDDLVLYDEEEQDTNNDWVVERQQQNKHENGMNDDNDTHYCSRDKEMHDKLGKNHPSSKASLFSNMVNSKDISSSSYSQEPVQSSPEENKPLLSGKEESSSEAGPSSICRTLPSILSSVSADSRAQWCPSRSGPSFPFVSSPQRNLLVGLMASPLEAPTGEGKGKQRAATAADQAFQRKLERDQKMRQERRQEEQPTRKQACSSRSNDLQLSPSSDEKDDNDDESPPLSIDEDYIQLEPQTTDTTSELPRSVDDQQTTEDEEEEGSDIEARCLLLNELEHRERQLNRDNRKTIEALSTCFRFEPEIDREQALQEIAEHITSIRPFGQWNTIRVLELTRQNITAITDLETVLPSLEVLDISNNSISELSRLPQSLQTLNVKTNRLTDIRGIQHLRNLQYLDICNNAIGSFDGISLLYHLRTLHAESNKITSCGPFKTMKGLMHLNLRGNAIRRLGFRRAKMENLETLDLSYNRIECLEAIEGLTGLRTLNLDHNDIKWIQLETPMEKLKVLRMSYNRLKAFDGSFFPDLRTLYLDDNQIVRIIGLSCVPRIDSFSLRDQGGQKVEVNMRYLRGARKLYLSGNALRNLNSVVDFFTLEYLELCAIQLEELPGDFYRQVPNLGALYLSHNYLKEIRPLRKLRHLQKLVLIDNRLQSLSDTLDSIRSLDRLRYLDFRQNPISSKLYPSIYENFEVHGGVVKTSSCSDRISRYLAHEHDKTWLARDAEFCRSLPPHWKERRGMYRALFIKCCPKLRVLDGVPLTESEINGAEDIMAKLRQEQRRQQQQEEEDNIY